MQALYTRKDKRKERLWCFIKKMRLHNVGKLLENVENMF